MVEVMKGQKYRVVDIPIGPQHPALHEPIMLRVKVDGEEVVDVKVITGYNHRGIEKLCEMNTPIRITYICGRVCGICNTVHNTCIAQGIEKVAGIEPPPRANFLRTIGMELERIHSHYLIIAILAELLGFDSLFMLMMRDRERVMYLKEILTGQRVLADYAIPGGVKRDLSSDAKDIFKKHLAFLEERAKHYKKLFEEDPVILKRTRDVGVIKTNEAVANCLVGPTLRGSGVKSDVRYEDPHAAYGEIPFNVITYPDGDSWSRMMVRFDEIFESINIVRYALDHLPSGPAVADPRKLPRNLPPGEAISRVEAQRGELCYHLISKGGPKFYRVKIRTPSFNNILGGVIGFREATLADVPIIFGSYDPCIACAERSIIIELKDGRKRTFSLLELGKYVNKKLR